MKNLLPIFMSTFMLLSCESKKTEISYHDAQYGYSETVLIKELHQSTIYISGQVGKGDSLATQMKNALINLRQQLKKHGADYADLVKINTYIVDYKPSDLATFRQVRKETFGEEVVPASTLVGVQSLALPEWRIEIDAIAVIAH